MLEGCQRVVGGMYIKGVIQPHLVMTSSVINRNSNKADIIQGAEEYIAVTDKQLKDLRDEKQALVILLVVAASAALLF